MREVISADMKIAHRAEVGYSQKTFSWRANGYFERLDFSNEYVYVYIHQVHASLSGILFSELKECFDVKEGILREYPICKVHDNHDFLAPYMMDNDNLEIYYSTMISKCGEDANRARILTEALAALNSGG